VARFSQTVVRDLLSTWQRSDDALASEHHGARVGHLSAEPGAIEPTAPERDADITRRGLAPDEPTRKVGDAGPRPLPLTLDALLGDGRYQIRGVLGAGGTSVVYDAFDHELERRVAIKVLHDGEAAAALLDEAKTQAGVSMSSIVGVYALHLDARPPFMVLEHVDGVSLDRRLRGGDLSWNARWRVLHGIAEALDHLHDRGIAHGDVKAANVLVSHDGHAKLADFGLTRLLRRTSTGDLVGTPTYLPPERAVALPVASDLLTAGDVYSFAVLVYVVLAGRPPFVEASVEALLCAHATEPPPALSELCASPSALDAPLARGLSKVPSARPRRAGALMRELEAAARGLDAEGRPLHVLVVDDDDAHRLLHVEVLRQSLPAAVVESASSGPEALERIADRAPDVLVVDLAMPEVSGLELADRARHLSDAMSVVVVTGQGSGRERTAAIALGVRHFLVKPVEADELARCVVDCAASRIVGG
jgi:CheY-like chemotaxis protein